MTKITLPKRLTALVTALVILIGLLPSLALSTAAAAQSGLAVTGKISDPDSFNNWRDYYGLNSLLPDGTRGISTWKAGGVWTDKSVYSDATSFPNSIVMDNQDNNFLVALSALASNKEIVGQSSTPTDSFLVLDVSGSMDDNDKAEGMVEAANRAIHSLMAQNINNRVGVMLYSGTRSDNGATATTLLLPLEHYSTTSQVDVGTRFNPEYIPAYLTISDDNSSPDVGIASGVRYGNNQRPASAERTVTGATYIQRGLYDAWKEFEKVTDVKVPAGNVQAGTQRSPVIILMSDGRPTLATDNYNNVSLRNSEYGNGTEDSTSWETVFLTQLTAAWVKGAVADHYGTDANLYTLGLGTSNDRYATDVLDPGDTTNSNIVDWWNNFTNGTKRNDGTVRVQNGSFYQSAWDIPYDDDRFATSIGRSYSDGYWSADDVTDMIGAFQEIIDEIGLQSAYSATLVEKSDADLDGYITVQDELGSMMQVKDIKGILLGSTLFSGAELAKSMNEGLLGSTSNPLEYGNALVLTVKERIGITDTSTAQNLIHNAYINKQLNYVSDSDYSNYIGWYGDENNAYLGFWHESYGYGMEGAPDGAKYINKSYGYLGGSAGTDGAADMMHIVVMVHTEITTGHQTVLFKIPSSLIPMVEYKVELNGNSLETATEISLTVTESDPIRLVYEVGLPDDVNSINIDQKVADYMAQDGSNHIHKDANGNYVFYASGWDNNHDDVAPIISDLNDTQKLELTKHVAESHFVPNTVNERFYVLENSVVYTKNGNTYTPVTTSVDTNGTYYFARTIVTVRNGTAKNETQYELLQPATVANTNNFQKNTATGYWEIKAGTVRQQLSNTILPKTPANLTGTLPNTDHLWVNVAGNNPSDYNIYSFLGNNGKLTVTPATGIKITKDVTELADGASSTEKFAVTVTLAATGLTPVITDTDGNLLTNYSTAESAGNTMVTVHLADDESAVISGLPADVTYTVSEAAHEKYTPSYTGANITVNGVIVENTVTNMPIKPGSLYITKEVVHAHEGETFPTDYEFEFNVTFIGPDGNPIANTEFQLENNYDPTITALSTDANGVMTGWLRHGETVNILNIPAGTTVTVEEVNLPTDGNYTLSGYRSRNQSGGTADTDNKVTIQAEHNATVVVTNTYTPKATSVNLDVIAHKTVVSDTAVQNHVILSFEIEKWNPQTQMWDSINKISDTWYKDEITLSGGSAEKDFFFDTTTLGAFTEAGTYTYRVVEKEPVPTPTPGLAYDKTVHTIIITVTDVNGQLTATVKDENGNPITDIDTPADGTLDFTANFTNEFDSAPVSIEIVKIVNNLSNTPQLSKEGFQFAAYAANANWELLDNTPDITVTSDSNGSARLTATYTAEGVHYYVVKELHTQKAGWTDFSDAEYRITVTVNNVSGNLTASINIVKVDSTPDSGEVASANGNEGRILFKNTYNPESAKVDLNVQPTVAKTLENRTLRASEFQFAIFKNGQASFADITNAIMIGTNDATGHVSFTATEHGIAQGLVDAQTNTLIFSQVGKYEFDIVELTGTNSGITYDTTIFDLVVEVTDNRSGVLQAKHYFEDSVAEVVTFRNTYSAAPTSVVIQGLKTIQVNSGAKSLTSNMFTFGLYENNVQIDETKNLANGSFAFGAIEYTLADAGNTFTYVVKEIIPNDAVENNGIYTLNGVTYSNQAFTVTVKVIDNGDGTLSTEVNGNGSNTIKFVNEYDSALAKVTLNGLKELNGRALKSDEYQFTLYSSNAAFTEIGAIVAQNGKNFVTNNGNGEFSFQIDNLDMGYHYYILRELIPEERATGISYDASTYHITVQVIDGGNGQMRGITTVSHSGQPNVVNPDIVFKNLYSPEPGELPLSGNKNYNGGKTLENDVFSVGLYDSEGNLLQTAPIKANGSFTFENLQYQASDVGQTYTYTIQEIIPTGAVNNGNGTYTLGKIIYDGSVYTLKVKITDDDTDGTLNIAPSLSKGTATADAITFTNTYVPDPVTHTVIAKKTYEKGLAGDDFQFSLTAIDGKTNVNQTKKNAVDGKVTFDAISFPEAGEYKFKLVEKKDSTLSFILPSQAEYEITVTVKNTNGVLSVANVAAVNTKDTGESDLEFINTYVIDGEDDITIRGTKKLTGGRVAPNAEEFQFGLYDAAGTLVDSAKNDANGNFAFTTLHFDETDVPVNGQKQITYTVKEIAGSDIRVTYDQTVYTVVVTVKDNDKGGVTASYTVNGAADGEISFTNVYTPKPEDLTLDFNVVKTVVNKGGEKIGPEGFEFLLDAQDEGAADATVKTDGNGNAKFTMTFTENDIGKTYTYILTEVNGGKANVTYSTAKYTIQAAVGLDGNNKLFANLTVNGEAATAVSAAFENVYDYTVPTSPTPPKTGDSFMLPLWICLVFVSGGLFGVTLYTKKRLVAKN